MLSLAATESASSPSLVVKMDKASFRARDDTIVLHNINFEGQASKFHVVIGPTWSGKTTLLQAILGELSLESGSASICIGSITYCSQTPWLQNLSIRDNIVAGIALDRSWYSRVVSAVALDADFPEIPDWDKSLIGRGGLALSGGQKQRVVRLQSLIPSGPRFRLTFLDRHWPGLCIPGTK
jgi:ATP-binding cassette, subfamily C (CFTR/MRP), member 1